MTAFARIELENVRLKQALEESRRDATALGVARARIKELEAAGALATLGAPEAAPRKRRVRARA